MQRRTLLIGIALVLCFRLPAQTEDSRLRVGLSLNGITYLGDLSEPGFGIWRVNAGGELSLERVRDQWLGMSFHAGFGQFTEQWDQPDNQPGTRFVQTPFLHGDFRLHARAPQGVVQPYASLGAGLLSFSPRDRDGIPLGEGTYNTIIPQLPVSAGLRWQINRSIGFDLCYTWRFTPSDFLDNIGEEGGRSGFDALHAINIGLQFDLFEGEKEGMFQVATDTLAVDSVQVADETADADSPATQELTTSEYDESDYDRKQALESVEAEIFLYYETKSGETLDELALRFRVPPDLLRELNFLPQQTRLKRGTYVRIPHVENR